jgi:hypothetical protein
MKSLARAGDNFIINTWEAKHAATHGIKDIRADTSTAPEPRGKSATSLLESIAARRLNASRTGHRGD